jgi:hypothetical protein
MGLNCWFFQIYHKHVCKLQVIWHGVGLSDFLRSFWYQVRCICQVINNSRDVEMPRCVIDSFLLLNCWFFAPKFV